MGGYIAQTMAIEHPGRVMSLVSMMSTTGGMHVGQPSPEVLREVFGGPPATTREEVIQMMLRAARAVGSPGYPMNEGEVAARTGRAYDRCHDPVGAARQAIARLPQEALVIHGLANRVCGVSGGRATADAIPGADLVLIEGMGHDLPPGLRRQLAERIAEFVWRVERAIPA
jgi:pimeloyl-ACP methyl ester carboxylesterase